MSPNISEIQSEHPEYGGLLNQLIYVKHKKVLKSFKFIKKAIFFCCF